MDQRTSLRGSRFCLEGSSRTYVKHISILVLHEVTEVFPAVQKCLAFIKRPIILLNPYIVWQRTNDCLCDLIVTRTNIIRHEIVSILRISLVSSFGRFVWDVLVIRIIPFRAKTFRDYPYDGI